MGPAQVICPICGDRYDPSALFCPKDGAPLGAKPLPAGADPYLGIDLPGEIRIEQLIGSGSMGRVYRAHQAGIDRSVAVKILHAELSANPTLVTRFHREAKIASQLAHPNVVQVFMTGELPRGAPGAGALYMVMEHLDGLSLRSALAAAGGALSLPRALRIFLQICDAVGEAHAQGIVHRDLKPENVMLVRRGQDADFVKVLDFGIARVTRADAPALTKAGLIFGSARYVSPEGAQGNPVGPAGDVYSLATILYQTLAGQPPFSADSTVTLLLRQIQDPPPPIGSIARAAYLPAPLASAIMKNLGKRAEERSPDARAFGRELLDAARASGMSADDLVARSALLGAPGPARPPAFASIERTKELPFGPAIARGIEAAKTPLLCSPAPALAFREPAEDELRAERRRKSAPRAEIGPAHQARVAALLIACVGGGAALAALGAYRFGLIGAATRELPSPEPNVASARAPVLVPPGSPSPFVSAGAAPDAAPPPAASTARSLL
jgi:serine/threonine protein kinase